MIVQSPNIIECPKCHARVDDRANFCPHCGLHYDTFGVKKTQAPVVQDPARRKRNDILAIGLVIAWVSVLGLAQAYSNPQTTKAFDYTHLCVLGLVAGGFMGLVWLIKKFSA